MNIEPTPTDRYQTIVAMLKEIIIRLDVIERDVDEMDQALRPYGDGTKPRRQRP